MATAENIIKRALRSIQVASRGYTPTAEEMNEAFEALNELINDWQNEHLIIPNRVRESFDVVVGTRTYTIGPTGDWVTANFRPVSISSAFLRDTANIDYPLDVLLTAEQEGSIALKSTGGRPDRLYYERGDPNGIVRFDRAPSDPGDDIYIDMLKALVGFTSLTSEDNVEDRYISAIRYNLGVRLAPEYGKDVPQDVRLLAATTLDAIKRDNLSMRVPTMVVDSALDRRRTYGYNINDGY